MVLITDLVKFQQSLYISRPEILIDKLISKRNDVKSTNMDKAAIMRLYYYT